MDFFQAFLNLLDKFDHPIIYIMLKKVFQYISPVGFIQTSF